MEKQYDIALYLGALVKVFMLNKTAKCAESDYFLGILHLILLQYGNHAKLLENGCQVFDHSRRRKKKKKKSQ